MSVPVDRVGQFRAAITSYGLQESKDGAVGIAIKAKLLAWFDMTATAGDGSQGEWVAWEQYGMEAEGVLWVVKKNGEINELAAKSLIANAGWDGSLESIAGQTWQATPCQVAIEEDEYKDQTRLRIGFINDFDRNPLGMGSVNPEKAKALQARFGSQLRAIAGNAKRNAAPANGAPPTPPAPSNVRPVMATAFDAPEHDSYPPEGLPPPPSRGDKKITF